MDDKEKKISNSYKDYKYEYTGYKNYLKEHHLDKESVEDEIKKEKEDIDHNHAYQFDFNNPNEHHHDYSFDFEDSPKIPDERSYSVKTNDIYEQSPKSNYNPNTSYNKNDNKKQSKIVFYIIGFIILIEFVFPIIFGIIKGIVLVNENDDNNYNTNDYYTEELTDELEEPINSFCDAFNHRSYTYLKGHVINYRDLSNWQSKINSLYNKEHENTCGNYDFRHLSYSETRNLENNYNTAYNENLSFDDAYEVTIEKLIDDEEDYFTNDIKITIVKVYNTWYLLYK